MTLDEINVKEGPKNDEEYIISLCDLVLGQVASRQHRFDFLRGDGDPGRKLPVDAYYPELDLVVEYREKQHSEPVKLWDLKKTISGVTRGQQRQIYDQRRRDLLPQQGIELVELNFSEFVCNNRKRLLRNSKNDKIIVEKRLNKWIPSHEETSTVKNILWIAGLGFGLFWMNQLESKFRRDVVQGIVTWNPSPNCKKESDYRSSLADHFRNKIGECEVIEEDGYERRRIDISVRNIHKNPISYGERLAIELKLNLSRNTELDRLIGQVVGYQEAKYDGAIVVSINPEPNFRQLLDKKQNAESLKDFLMVVQKDFPKANTNN